MSSLTDYVNSIPDQLGGGMKESMSATIKERAIEVRQREIMLDKVRVGEILDEKTDVIASMILSCRYNSIHIGNEIVKLVRSDAYDIAKEEYEYESQSNTLDLNSCKGLNE